MLKAALSAGVVAVLAVMLLVSRAPQSAEAATLFVFNPSDSGFGTLRWAVDQANGNASIDRIVVKTTVPVTLYEPVVYKGSQTLMVQGDHALLYRVIQGNLNPFAAENGCALFMSIGGADITFYQLVFRNSWCNGIDVIGEDGDGEIAVTLNKVIVEDNAGTGVYLLEELAESGATAPVTPASFKLTVISSFIRDNGACLLDACERDISIGDGVVVDETGDGGIAASCTGSSFTGNGGDGLELYEEDAGNVTFTATNCVFSDNGHMDLEAPSVGGDEDVESEADDSGGSGLNIQELGNGDATLTLNTPVVASGNRIHGVRVFEFGDGKLTLTATGLTADDNGTGIRFGEFDGGSATMKLTNTRTWNISRGIDAGESGSGDMTVEATGSSANFNGIDGYEISESGDGKLTAKFQTVVANGNDFVGFSLRESGAGAFSASIYGSTAQGNGEFAVEARAETETGTIAFGTSTLLGVIDLDNINVIP